MHMIQLDGVRALAVASVIVQHYLGPVGRDYLPIGSAGVRVFFVLSGFLITGILLREHQRAVGSGHSIGHSLKHFYSRRFLRIIPLAYAVLMVCTILNVEHIRDRILWHVFYLSNIYYVKVGTFIGPDAPFWSLAVEEQFYLVWPWLMLLMPRKSVLSIIIAFICIGPIFRIAATLAGCSGLTATTLTPSCLDTLGAGGLLAYLFQHHSTITNRLVKASLWAAIPSFGFILAIHAANALPKVEMIFFDTASLFVGVYLVGQGAIGFRGAFGKFLQHPALVFIGSISYGIYVYHGFIPRVVVWGLPYLHIQPTSVVKVLVSLPLLLITATISWFCFEKPLNDLKRYFPYAKRPSTIGEGYKNAVRN